MSDKVQPDSEVVPRNRAEKILLACLTAVNHVFRMFGIVWIL